MRGHDKLLFTPKTTSAKAPQRLSDGALVAQFVDGNRNAFEELLARYHRRIYSYILAMATSVDVANNIMQDTLLMMMKSLLGGHYKDRGEFSEWCMCIVQSYTIRYYQTRDEEMEVLRSLPEDIPVTGYALLDLNAEEQMVVKERRRELHLLLEYLPAEQREVVKLRYYDEYSFKEIARMLNISINTALGRVRYAQINLRKMMTNADARAKMRQKK